MSVQNAALNRAASGLSGSVTELSLHTSDGGSNGNDELSGGDYDRIAPDYTTPTNGVANLNEDVTFAGPSAPGQVTHLGFWDGETWLGSSALPEPRIIGPGDTLRIINAPVYATPNGQ